MALVRTPAMNAGPGFEVGLQYDNVSSHITGVWCDNQGPYTIDCSATLVDENGVSGNTYYHTFPIGMDQLLFVPDGVGTIVPDPSGNGELIFTGLGNTSVSPHL